MNPELRYCPRLAETVARLRRLYADRAQDIVLAVFSTPSPVLAAWTAQQPAGYCAYTDPRARPSGMPSRPGPTVRRIGADVESLAG